MSDKITPLTDEQELELWTAVESFGSASLDYDAEMRRRKPTVEKLEALGERRTQAYEAIRDLVRGFVRAPAAPRQEGTRCAGCGEPVDVPSEGGWLWNRDCPRCAPRQEGAGTRAEHEENQRCRDVAELHDALYRRQQNGEYVQREFEALSRLSKLAKRGVGASVPGDVGARVDDEAIGMDPNCSSIRDAIDRMEEP